MKLNLVLLMLGLLLNLSCAKENASSGPGPQTSTEAIANAQDKAMENLNPYTIEEGQSVHFVETQEVITSQGPIKQLSKEWIIDVTEVSKTSESHTITTLKTMKDLLYDKNFVYQFKNVSRLAPLINSQVLSHHGVYFQQLAEVIKQAEETTNETVTVDGIAYHNLNVQSVKLVPPKLVEEKTNCGGIPDCRINAEQITFDIRFLLTDGSIQKYSVETLISADVPFFAGLLKQCSNTLIPIDNIRVMVKQCSEVVDF